MRLLPVLVLFLLVPAAAGLPDRLEPRAPFADFTWSPDGVGIHENVTFVSTSMDFDGMIVLSRWYLPGDDDLELRLGSSMTTSFPKSGSVPVTLEVTDNTLLTTRVTRVITILNAPPVLDMVIEPSPAYRGAAVSFVGLADDPEGDNVTEWTWSHGDGKVSLGREAAHTYATLGTYTIELSATDASGNQAFVSRMLRVVNQPPQVMGDFAPRPPAVGQTVQFTAQGIDPDVPGGEVTFSWHFSDGVVLSGAQVSRAFSTAGDHSVTLRGEDADGGASAPYVLLIPVQEG